jgi:hypothetical protein
MKYPPAKSFRTIFRLHQFLRGSKTGLSGWQFLGIIHNHHLSDFEPIQDFKDIIKFIAMAI